MRTTRIALIALLAVGAVGVVVFLTDDSVNQPLSQVDALPSPINSNSDRTSAAPQTNSVPVERPTPDRLIVSGNESQSIFADVLDEQIDHASIENFLAARPIGAYRIVTVNSDGLRDLIRQSSGESSFTVRLINEEPITLVPKDAKEHSSGWKSGLGTWRGKVAGDEMSRASFVISPDGTVDGVVRTVESGRIKIEPIDGTNLHIVWQLSADFKREMD